MKAAWLLAGVLVLSATSPRSLAADEQGPVRLSIRADKSEVTVGEAFTVEVEGSGPAGTAYTFPPAVQGDAAELVSLAPKAASPGTSLAAWPAHQHRYEARVFALGEASLPTLTVSYRLPDGTDGQVEAPPLKVKVVS
ncbi:MAG TPA: hypothetical protein VIZ31_03545, partial [Vicinamibacteria bacterium]